MVVSCWWEFFLMHKVFLTRGQRKLKLNMKVFRSQNNVQSERQAGLRQTLELPHARDFYTTHTVFFSVSLSFGVCVYARTAPWPWSSAPTAHSGTYVDVDGATVLYLGDFLVPPECHIPWTGPGRSKNGEPAATLCRLSICGWPGQLVIGRRGGGRFVFTVKSWGLYCVSGFSFWRYHN